MDIGNDTTDKMSYNQESELQPKKHKPKIFQIFITLFFMLVLPVLFVLIGKSQESQDIRSKASVNTRPAGKILFVPFYFTHDKDGDKIFNAGQPELRNGYIPKNQLSGKDLFTAIYFDKKGKVINRTKFSPPELVSIDGYNPITDEHHGETGIVLSNKNGITLNYYPEAERLRIIKRSNDDKDDIDDDVRTDISLKNLKDVDNIVHPTGIPGNRPTTTPRPTKILPPTPKQRPRPTPTFIPRPTFIFRPTASPTPVPTSTPTSAPLPIQSRTQLNILHRFIFSEILAAEGSFNLAIIGDNYGGNTALFNIDVNDIINGLVSIEPFASNKSKIAFYPQLSTDQICTPISGWPSISCNDTKALQQASNLPYDKIYVLYNGPYTGYAYVGGILAYGTSSTDRSLSVKQGIFIHELAGHAIGELMDEYSYGTTGVAYGPNCSSSSVCSSWSGISGLGCYATCGYTNLYRATSNNSVMNTAFFNGIISFDQYSTQLVQEKLSSYLNPQFPTSTSIPVTPSFTPTITPVPASPSPSITSTPTSTLTPTVTLTSTPIPTPTPSVIPTLIPSPRSIQSMVTPPIVFSTLTPTPSGFIPNSYSPTNSPTPTDVPTVAPTNSPTPSSTSTPTPTPSSTLTPAPTSTPSPLPTVSPSISPSPTIMISACKYPNYCTLSKFCDDTHITDISCGRSDRVCCRSVEEDVTPSPETPNISPTERPFNVFIPLPSATPTSIPGMFLSPTPTVSLVPATPTSIPGMFLSPTPTVALNRLRILTNNILYGYPSPTSHYDNQTAPTSTPTTIERISGNTPTEYINQIPSSTPVPVENTPIPQIPTITNKPTIFIPPTITDSIGQYVYESPTPFNIETMEFEHITPTPQQSSFFEGVGFLGSMFSSFFGSLLPGIFR